MNPLIDMLPKPIGIVVIWGFIISMSFIIRG